MDGSAQLPPPAPVGITELKNNFASIAKRIVSSMCSSHISVHASRSRQNWQR